MKTLKKIDENTNVITWFEIPVSDTGRAKAFYETILDIKMTTRSIPETNEELTFFPYDPNIVQATSGRITGVLSKSENNQPSGKGTLVYINAYPEIQKVLDKVEPAGGKIISPPMQMNAGYIAVIIDTEGNRIGLHAEK
ncbi:bleomycin resistance protein [Chryseobacterium piperi]|uniref:Bleomycin resistance protein n=1 Tax=Chryseobacterium piperi TaxID=558152 RepID=A0A086ANA0_9FLAO|nr:VOC family protein [Chryseobacterium piperi]ASW76244.1 glyoxalase/bleomycin resistance/extradiol dioxygenase family protein [Chryseobacterium piperi]KFF18164.1 bleomycin resistance protein [Chryseobacterium piperi]